MTVRHDPSALRWLIGRELRRARLHARRTQADAAKALNCTPARINYLESGRNQQQPDQVGTLLRLYDVPAEDANRLVTLAGRADDGSWFGPFSDALPNWFKTFVGLEGLARATFLYNTVALPGQLQTRDYAAALLTDNLRVSPAEVGPVVRARLSRQRLLDDNDTPLQCHAVIEEAILDRMVGGPMVMRGQLEHLLALVERDNVTLQVLPTSVAVHDGLDGPFVLLDFAEARSIAYIEYRDGAVYVQDQDMVEAYNLVAERLAELALSDADSAEAIRKRMAAMT